jgi:uncharacterized protein YndB with AHSA1/START domain
MSTATQTAVTTHMYEVFIKAPRETVWDALTSPEWARRYGYQCPLEIDLRPGGSYKQLPSEGMKASGWHGDGPVVEGDILEVDRPSRIVETWQPHFGGDIDAEGATHVTFELSEFGEGVTKLRVIHELEGAPLQLEAVTSSDPQMGGGWSWILNDLKSVVETGKRLSE